MKETPLLMCGEMVCATLEGRKTQTRRIVKPQPRHRIIKAQDGQWYDADCINPGGLVKCPYGKPGDRLWVRETFYIDHFEYHGKLKGLPPLSADEKERMLYYAADGDVCGQIPECQCCDGGPVLRPSIFMPRCLSRITLEVTEVRVERVQDISEEDAVAEGINCEEPFKVPYRGQYVGVPELRYAHLWDSLNLKRGFGWDVNPWVWVVGFKRI